MGNCRLFFMFIALLVLITWSIGIVPWYMLIQTHAEDAEQENGTRWAVLLPGSQAYKNYRHQRDADLVVVNQREPDDVDVVKLREADDLDGFSQRDAGLAFMWLMYNESDKGSEKKSEFLRDIRCTMRYRMHMDMSVKMIGFFLFGPIHSSYVLTSSRKSGPLVDDWECFESMIRVFETHCGSLETQDGMAHTLAFANFCNKGVSLADMEEACVAACAGYNFKEWIPVD